MFETSIVDPPVAGDPGPPSSWPDQFVDAPPGPADEVVPAYSPARARPSGWLALELDTATRDETSLDDAELVDAIVAFDRVGSWASARQARLLAEFARRRPGDDPQAIMTERPCRISPFAPDEVGVALTPVPRRGDVPAEPGHPAGHHPAAPAGRVGAGPGRHHPGAGHRRRHGEHNRR